MILCRDYYEMQVQQNILSKHKVEYKINNIYTIYTRINKLTYSIKQTALNIERISELLYNSVMEIGDTELVDNLSC